MTPEEFTELLKQAQTAEPGSPARAQLQRRIAQTIRDIDTTTVEWARIDWADFELNLTQAVTGSRPAVRRDCAFCGWERSAKDDNHAPECSYWDFFGGAA